MAGSSITYYRNWSDSDSEFAGTSTTGGVKSFESFGWVAPTGREFKEWNDSRDGSGTAYQAGDSFTGIAPQNLYAQYSATISKIVTPDGAEYNIKDATARNKDAYPTSGSTNAVQSTGLYDISRLVQGENFDTVEVGNTASLIALKGDISQTRPTYNGNSLALLSDVSGGTQNTWYGVCPTGATTQAKLVTTTTGDFSLEIGNMVRVKFNNAQTYNGGITLNVDGTGAKSAMRNGTTATTRYFYLAGEVVDFVYDGTYFMAVNEGIASTTYYGVTKLTNSATSTSTTTSATPNAVKLAYDLANSKSIVSVAQTLTSGTEIGSVTVDGTATTLYAPSGSGGSTVSVSQIATTGDNIADITVDGTTTNVYNGVTALTDPEIEEAVDDAFPVAATHSIESPYGSVRSITNNGSYGENVTTKITEANSGETITFAADVSVPHKVETVGGETVATTTGASYDIQEGPVTTRYVVYSFVMPNDDVTITLDI